MIYFIDNMKGTNKIYGTLHSDYASIFTSGVTMNELSFHLSISLEYDVPHSNEHWNLAWPLSTNKFQVLSIHLKHRLNPSLLPLK